MDEITEDLNPPQTERELASPLNPKRPRTDCEITNNHSGTSRFNFPELIAFQKTFGSSLPTNMFQRNMDQVCTAECGDTVDEKPLEQQDSKLIFNPLTKLITSHTDSAQAGSSKDCCVTAGGHFLLLVKDEQPLMTERDKLSSSPVNVAGWASAESHTFNDASADTSSHPDCKRLRESLEEEPLGGCGFPSGTDKDGTQVQNSISQIQAFNPSSDDGWVRCQHDCTRVEMLHDTGLCNTWRQSAEVEESNQKRNEDGFSENTLFNKKDYTGTKSSNSHPEEDPFPCSLAESAKNIEKVLELHIWENKSVATCDEETKDHVNENSLSNNSIHSSTECAEGSIVSYDVLLARNIAFENEADGFCGAKGGLAAGKMIAKAQSETADHTTETPMPARISQEPTEGDNDAGPFSVIDPAIWNKIDREAEEKCCKSESTAGAELSPSVKVCEMEMPLPLCSDVKPSQEVSALCQTWQFNHQSRTQQCKDEKVDLCQSYTEPQACSITTNETHKTGNESSCLWKSRLSSSPKNSPAGKGRQESIDAMGRQLKEQHQLGCFSVSLGHPKTQEVEYLQTEIARMDWVTEMKEKEEITSSEEKIRTDECSNSEISMDLVERLLQNEEHKDNTSEILADNLGITIAVGKISEYDNKLTHSDVKFGSSFNSSFDHAYSAAIPITGKPTEKNESKEASVGVETDVHCILEILMTSKDGCQQQSLQKGYMTEVSVDDCISEWTDASMSKSGNILTLVSHCEQANQFSFSDHQNKVGTSIVENKVDHLAFSFPPTSDAVVPSPHELIPSQNADNNPTGQNCSDRISPVPSAFTFCNHVPRGFDTFQKILLSVDNDDGDVVLSNSPLLASLPGQMLKTPQRQLDHSMPEEESNNDKVVPEKEEEGKEVKEGERFECHTEILANGLLSSDYTSNEFPNFISAADVAALGWLNQQPDSEQGCNSSECFQGDLDPQSLYSTVFSMGDSPVSDVNDSPKFEKKKQFDMVLKEMSLYFDISISDLASSSRASSPEQFSDAAETLKEDTSSCKQLSSPELCDRDASSDDADEDRSLDMCGSDPVSSCTPGSGDGEQEVPLGSHVCQEAPMCTADKHKEPQEMKQERKMWSPSFMCGPLSKQLSHRPPEQPRRLEPLKTCTRPIRVGLSKRAKTKNLHLLQPYKQKSEMQSRLLQLQ